MVRVHVARPLHMVLGGVRNKRAAQLAAAAARMPGGTPLALLCLVGDGVPAGMHAYLVVDAVGGARSTPALALATGASALHAALARPGSPPVDLVLSPHPLPVPPTAPRAAVVVPPQVVSLLHPSCRSHITPATTAVATLLPPTVPLSAIFPTRICALHYSLIPALQPAPSGDAGDAHDGGDDAHTVAERAVVGALAMFAAALGLSSRPHGTIEAIARSTLAAVVATGTAPPPPAALAPPVGDELAAAGTAAAYDGAGSDVIAALRRISPVNLDLGASKLFVPPQLVGAVPAAAPPPADAPSRFPTALAPLPLPAPAATAADPAARRTPAPRSPGVSTAGAAVARKRLAPTPVADGEASNGSRGGTSSTRGGGGMAAAAAAAAAASHLALPPDPAYDAGHSLALLADVSSRHSVAGGWSHRSGGAAGVPPAAAAPTSFAGLIGGAKTPPARASGTTSPAAGAATAPGSGGDSGAGAKKRIRPMPL